MLPEKRLAQLRAHGARYRAAHRAEEYRRVMLWRFRNPEKHAAQVARERAKKGARDGA